MIILRNKLFSLLNRQEGLRNLSIFNDKVCLDIIKLVELYNNSNGQDIDHWIGMVKTFIENVLNSEKKISVGWKRPQLSFIKSIENKYTISKILGNDFIKEYCNSGIGKEYIENLWKEILNITQRGEKKYVDAIKNNGGFLVSSEDYILLFRYIALCLSGQLDYRNIDLWSDMNFISKIEVNYTINKNYQDLELKRIIANCIFQFKGNIPDPGENILKFL